MNLPLDEPLRWVFAGDSITHGALHTMGWRDYTELFSERLRHELKRPRDCVVKTGVLLFLAELLRLRLPELALLHDRAVKCYEFVLHCFKFVFPLSATCVDDTKELIDYRFADLDRHLAALQCLQQNVKHIEIAVAQVY